MININDAFKIITDTVGEALLSRGFKKSNVDSADDNEIVSLFEGENVAYSVVYYKDKMHMVMRECAVDDDGIDNDWRTLATWMFDPNSDTEKEARSIANDFADALRTPAAVKRVKRPRNKKKSDDEGNADPIFMTKRFVALFPQLKDEIRREEECYYPFRSVTFTKASIVPRVNEVMLRGDKKEIQKLMQIINAQYDNGDADTRSIITTVILNGIDPKYDGTVDEYLSDELKKAEKCSRKFRGKQVKPEKIKKKRKTVAQRLRAQQDNMQSRR